MRNDVVVCGYSEHEGEAEGRVRRERGWRERMVGGGWGEPPRGG